MSRVPIELKRGALAFAAADYQRWLPGVEAVVLLRDGDDLAVLPVRHAHAGGYLLKQRNLAGDRVAHVAGYFRDQGLSDDLERSCTAEWDEERGAFLIAHFFA